MRWPLMQKNVTPEDRQAIVDFLGCACPELHMPTPAIPRLTQGPQVAAFEREFADWLGVKYAVMVNSGASANLITMHALAQLYGKGEVIVPALTWSSDIMSVLHAGLTPVFMDINPRTLGMRIPEGWWKIGASIRAVFPTHCLGFNARIDTDGVPLIEDCCESLGATCDGKKLGTFGLASNFSFYYAHHLSTIEGGMVCTNDEMLYERLRILRSHGMVREMSEAAAWVKQDVANCYPDLHPEFIFSVPAFNVRSTELNAVLGRSQLKRLDANNARRIENLLAFLAALDPEKYRTDYHTEGSCNYALPLVLAEADEDLMRRVLAYLKAVGVEYRRGTAGGGNQLRQPYLKVLNLAKPEDFPETEHIHFFGIYIGNYPDLDPKKIEILCEGLNKL